MLNIYETTIIIDAHLLGEQVDAAIEKFSKYIDGNGGKVLSTDRWGKRRLAYEINKKQYGYYVYMRFEAEGAFLQELEREYKLDEAILRYLTVIVPKIVLKDEDRKAKRAEVESKAVESEVVEETAVVDVEEAPASVESTEPTEESPAPVDSTEPVEDISTDEKQDEAVQDEPPAESEEEKKDDVEPGEVE